MSQFVVGQWVECVDDHDFRHIRNGDFYRVDAVLGNGDIRLEHVDAIYGANRFRPVEWQVGKTYRTTLEGVTATIKRVTDDSVYGLDNRERFQSGPWQFHKTTGRLESYEDSVELPHLTPYLATPDEPKKERFTLGKIGEHWAVFDNEANEHAPFSAEANARSFYHRLKSGNVEKPGGYFWRDNPTKSEQIRDDAAKALEKVTGKVEQPDPINPPHYQQHPSGVECIQITECFNFNLGNAIKYIWRAGLKGDAVTDLEKAAWYLEREIKRVKGGA